MGRWEVLRWGEIDMERLIQSSWREEIEQTGKIRSCGIATLYYYYYPQVAERCGTKCPCTSLALSESSTAPLEAGPLGYAVFLGTEKYWGCPDVTACPSCTSSVRDGPCSEIPDSTGSREQPPVVSVQTDAELPYAQCHPSGVARSPAFTGGISTRHFSHWKRDIPSRRAEGGGRKGWNLNAAW